MKMTIAVVILAASAMFGQAPNPTESTLSQHEHINWKLACNQHLPHVEQAWVKIDAKGCASWDESKYPTHPKEWAPAMCSKVGHGTMNGPVGEGYIDYCIRNAPNAKPSCPAPASVKSNVSHGRASYFEPLDCTWHMGNDPRLQK